MSSRDAGRNGRSGGMQAWAGPLTTRTVNSSARGIMIATIMYQKIAKWVIARFRLEDKLDPLFSHTMRKVKWASL